MPRALTDEERARVRERLCTLGRDRFVRLGLARTTVEGLAADAGIGKGSFYQFHPSKEDLFLTIAHHEEAEFRRQLLHDLEAQPSGPAAIETLLRAPTHRVDAHPFLRLLLDPATLGALRLRLPPERLEGNEAGDREFFVGLARAWQDRGWIRDDLDPHEVFHALSGLFLIGVQRELVSPDVAEGATATLIAALVERWSPAGSSPA